MFSSHRVQSITCGHCGYVQNVRLRSTRSLPNALATALTLGAWSAGWWLIARRNARSNRQRCCAYCGEYLLAYSLEERAAAQARREGEMAGELSGPEPTLANRAGAESPGPAPQRLSRRLPSHRD